MRAVLKDYSGVSERNMFGGVAFMVHGHMCCGIVKTDLMLRLTPDAAAASLKKPHTKPMDFTGRPMPSMIYVDAHGTDSDRALRKWIEMAHAFVQTLPPKQPSRKNSARGRSKSA